MKLQAPTRYFDAWSAWLAIGMAALSLACLPESSTLGRWLVRASYDGSHLLAGPVGSVSESSPVVLVYLDLESHLREKQNPAQPWDRALHARLVRRLTQAGARAVVFDILFSNPGNPGPDAELMAAIRENRNVILPAEIAQSDNHPGGSPGLRSQTLTLPYQDLLNVAAGIGLANVTPDDDFVVRRSFAGSALHQRESLTEAVARHLGLPSQPAMKAPGWIRYYGRALTIPHVSYSNALDPEGESDDFFENKVVFIGARPLTGGFAERRDEFQSPFPSWRHQLFMPAVEIHATQMLNRLRQDGLRRLSPRAESGWLLASGSLLVFGLARLRPVPAAMAAAIATTITVGLAQLAFSQTNVWFPWLIIVAVQVPIALTSSVLAHSLEWYQTRQRLEEARRIADAKIREQAALIDQAQDAILVQDLAGTFVFSNPGATTLYRWTCQEFGQSGVTDQMFAPCRDQAAQARATTLRQGEWQGEMVQATRDGRSIIVQSRWTLLSTDTLKPKAILTINSDITDRKQIEAQFLRSQRMEAVWSLAGGMAHDLNNALSPVLLGIQRLKKRISDDETQRMLTVMESNTHRGADMVRQVLTFSRGRDGERSNLDPALLLREMERIITQTFPKSISPGLMVPPDLWQVTGNATQLHQVLLNLCVNARDAMPQGGQLTLAADNVTLSAEEAREIPNALPGDYLMLLVADTGTGISPDVLPKLFEPFFTTKPPGEGTGLGLSTTARIVASHGGFIHLRSELGAGTTFEVYLPKAKAAPAAHQPATSSVVPRGKDELILVVDDDTAVREMLTATLQEHGYRFRSASNGAEGLSILLENPPAIRLVLTDADMPVLDGYSMIQQIRKRLPQLPIILMSGQASAGAMEATGSSAFLAKPFTAETLLEMVHRHLGATG
ncbi:MAG: CHASE2 domain-containing protein [Verrucomicrobiales bacterium]|nr:CHASE2 domain-containing protein [Verrucomicrobiales bacterium]